MKDLQSLNDIRRAAACRLPRMAFDFIEGGAGDEQTIAANREAFARWMLRPHYLQDVATRDQTTTILGSHFETPVVLAPTGLQRIAHLEGEVAAARAARACGTVYVLTSHSSRSLEEVVAAAGPENVWFQL